MLQILTEGFNAITNCIIAGAETILNLLFAGIQAVITAAVSILPSLPPVVAPPEFVSDVNWFFPVGAVVSVATGLLFSYGIFLGVRWLLVKFGLIGG